jgi:4'-phosphopantetheinyl transferase
MPMMDTHLDAGDLHVWHASPGLAAAPESRRACLDLLDGGERERMGRLRVEADRVAYLAVHALLRSALSRVAPVAPRLWRFRSGRLGKPSIDEPASLRHLAFSLSRTRGRVVVAVADHAEVGVDVEDVVRAGSLLEHPDRILSPAEAKALRALPSGTRLHRLTACWTLKEAYLKACGLGLSVPPQALSFYLDEGPDVRVSFEPAIQDDPSTWRFLRLSASSDHPMAVAFRCEAGSEVRAHVHEVREIPLGLEKGAAATPS